VHIKSEIPREFFDLYAHGNFTLHLVKVDAGCAQGNFIHIDAEKTFLQVEEFYSRADTRLTEEKIWLEEENIDLILSDIASLPLQAGKQLDIPRLLIANFTWHDIYNHLPGASDHRDLLDHIHEEYTSASLQVLPQCHLANKIIDHQQEVGLIAMTGQDKRQELGEFLNTSLEHKTLVFIYLGEIGESPLDWKYLENLEDCVFISRDPLPRNINNLVILDQRFRYPDLIASSDLVCTKAGYSTLATAFAHNKPVITCSRENFIEFEAMKMFLQENGVGIVMEADKFYACQWQEDIKEAQKLTVKGKVKLHGEFEVLKIIRQMLDE
jgi:hypothetical protein